MHLILEDYILEGDTLPQLKAVENARYRSARRVQAAAELESPAAVEAHLKQHFRTLNQWEQRGSNDTFRDRFELLLVDFHHTEKGGIVVTFTTPYLLEELQKLTDRAGCRSCPFFSTDTRYGQLAANQGLHVFGICANTMENGEVRSSFYWFGFSVISVEDKLTFELTTANGLRVWNVATGAEPVECVSMVFGHDSRPGQCVGIARGCERRRRDLLGLPDPTEFTDEEAAKMFPPETFQVLDFYHKTDNLDKNCGKHVSVASRGKSIKSADVTRCTKQWASRCNKWLWFARLSFNKALVREYCASRYKILLKEKQVDLLNLSPIGIRWITAEGHNLIPEGRGLRVQIQSVFSVERQRTGGPYVRCAQYYACLNAHLGRDICVLTSSHPIHRKIPPAHPHIYAVTASPHFLFRELGAATTDTLRHPPHWGPIRR